MWGEDPTDGWGEDPTGVPVCVVAVSVGARNVRKLGLLTSSLAGLSRLALGLARLASILHSPGIRMCMCSYVCAARCGVVV